MEYIPQLVTDTPRTTNPHIHIVMRVPINPVIHSAFLDVIFQFYQERPVCLAAYKLGALHPERGYMVGHDHLFVGGT